MQAYHHQQHQLAGVNAANLLISSQQMNTMHHQQQQQQHQQQQLSLGASAYQQLVKPYLGAAQLGGHNQQQQQLDSAAAAAAVSGLAALAAAQQQQQQQQLMSSPSGLSVAAFAAKLMALDEHERHCLDTDHELMTHIKKAQSLVESRLQDIHASLATPTSNHHNQQHQQHQQHQQQHQNNQHGLVDENACARRDQLCNQAPGVSLNALALHNQRQRDLQHHQQQQQQQQQQQLLLSQNSYYNSFYAKQLALSQYAQMQQEQQQQQQQQQLMFMASRLYNEQTDSSVELNKSAAAAAANHNHQASQQTNNLTTTQNGNNTKNGHTNTASSNRTSSNNNNPTTAPALDLRTTPTGSRPMSAAGLSTAANSPNSLADSQTAAAAPLPPKKLQSSEYRKLQQLAECSLASELLHVVNLERRHNQFAANGGLSNPALDSSYSQQQQQQHHKIDKKLSSPGGPQASQTAHSKRAPNDHNNTHSTDICATRSSNSQRQQPLHGITRSQAGGCTASAPSSSFNLATGKKYKGEFDEPTPSQVLERQRQLNQLGHYHEQALESGQCACVIGSEFRDKTKREALLQLDRWRSMEIGERIRWKWDLGDLPEDIHLSEIKKFEDLRRDYSRGRADFGGASKRKPLSIRGTRQFLLMLYCLWGHPGREDPMQRDGYCPHCFAKIRTDNEQSTLVRVVNHFNMKHRRGANPRLSPRSDSRQSPAAVAVAAMAAAMAPQPDGDDGGQASSAAASGSSLHGSSHQVAVGDALMSVVENAAATVDQELEVVANREPPTRSPSGSPSSSPAPTLAPPGRERKRKLADRLESNKSEPNGDDDDDDDDDKKSPPSIAEKRRKSTSDEQLEH